MWAGQTGPARHSQGGNVGPRDLRWGAGDCPSANEGPSAAYSNGREDGEYARTVGSPLTTYLEVGIDDYAIGFRAGFFGQRARRKGTEERFTDVGGRYI